MTISRALRIGWGAALAIAAVGCTPEQAAPFGKLLFGTMIVFLIGIPIVFYREWRRRQGR